MSESLSVSFSKKEFFFYTTYLFSLGYSIFKLGSYIFNKINISNKRIKRSDRVREGILDMMHDTPLIYIKSLSELTGCKIYGKCEYFLPYTSKDRMIKNIILDSQK
jgi:hypothetical protein